MLKNVSRNGPPAGNWRQSYRRGLEIRYASGIGQNDEDIARKPLTSCRGPLGSKDRVKIKIERGWVTSEGRCRLAFSKTGGGGGHTQSVRCYGRQQRHRDQTKSSVSDVERQIRAAFRRNAEFDAENIVVTADGRTVTLTGQVGSYYGRTLASETAWSAPGVTEVHEFADRRLKPGCAGAPRRGAGASGSRPD